MVETTGRGLDLHMEEITGKGVLISILAKAKDNKRAGGEGNKGFNMCSSHGREGIIMLLEM